jgi:hypothetical protein
MTARQETAGGARDGRDHRPPSFYCKPKKGNKPMTTLFSPFELGPYHLSHRVVMGR